MTEKNESVTAEARQILEGISTIAAERRREAQPALDRVLPKWLLEVIQTEVVYTMNPRTFPLRVAAFSALTDLLKEKYSVSFARPTKNAAFSRTDITDQDIGNALIRSDEGIRFENGRFMRTATDFDVIRSININYETIHVIVQGVREIAELIVADVAEMVWAAAGAQKRWNDIRNGIQLIGYGTATQVDLGVPFEHCLSPAVQWFCQNQLLDGEKYALETGRRSVRHQFAVSPTLNGIWALDEVTINLFLFDQRTGRSETTRLNIGVTTRDSAGTGIVRIYSELPFNKHLECIAALREAIAHERAV
ncbi:MAG: hypothetical protein Q7T26_04945 [Dehalococcoidia bacterium]|nr:hypothetical protein [Dehalococcoidia bacterium]